MSYGPDWIKKRFPPQKQMMHEGKPTQVYATGPAYPKGPGWARNYSIYTPLTRAIKFHTENQEDTRHETHSVPN